MQNERPAEDPTVPKYCRRGPDKARRYREFGYHNVVREGALGFLEIAEPKDQTKVLQKTDGTKKNLSPKTPSSRAEKNSGPMNYSNFVDFRDALSDDDLEEFEENLSPPSRERYDRMRAEIQLTLVALSILTLEQIQELLASDIPPNSPYQIRRCLTILTELQKRS